MTAKKLLDCMTFGNVMGADFGLDLNDLLKVKGENSKNIQSLDEQLYCVLTHSSATRVGT